MDEQCFYLKDSFGNEPVSATTAAIGQKGTFFKRERMLNQPQMKSVETSSLDNLPLLTPRQAYSAMLDFLQTEFELSGEAGMVHLGGLLAELALEEDGRSADPGGVETFVESVKKVIARDSKDV